MGYKDDLRLVLENVVPSQVHMLLCADHLQQLICHLFRFDFFSLLYCILLHFFWEEILEGAKNIATKRRYYQIIFKDVAVINDRTNLR